MSLLSMLVMARRLAQHDFFVYLLNIYRLYIYLVYVYSTNIYSALHSPTDVTPMPTRKRSLALLKPDVQLTKWKIFETEDEGKHLVGRDSLRTGCVASYLVAFDRKTMRAKARSGQVYQLVGEPGLFLDVVDTWEAWSEANSIGTTTKDITEDLLAAATQATDLPQPRSNSKDTPLPNGTDARHVMRNAAVAAMLSDPTGAEALLRLSNVEVGHLFKAHLIQAIGAATVSNLDLSSTREEDEAQGRLTKRRGKEFPGLTSVSAANMERYSLVLQGRLLPAEDFCKADGITEQKLNEDVASCRIFTVEFESDQYYPIFALSNQVHRGNFAKVVRSLGDSTGWSKWKFFTTPSESLGGLTPLKLLMREEVDRAVAAATEFRALNAAFLSITRTTPLSN